MDEEDLSEKAKGFIKLTGVTAEFIGGALPIEKLVES